MLLKTRALAELCRVIVVNKDQSALYFSGQQFCQAIVQATNGHRRDRYRLILPART
jgi:hypothetical protein